MSPRKTTFEVVKLAEIAPLLTGAQEPGPRRVPARILSVTHDPSLASTREMLFNSVGFQVSSASTIDQAIQFCGDKKFDLVVIGHSIPLLQRCFLVRELYLLCDTPLLALNRPGEPPVPGVDYVFDSTLNPALLLEVVVNILKPSPGPGKSAD